MGCVLKIVEAKLNSQTCRKDCGKPFFTVLPTFFRSGTLLFTHAQLSESPKQARVDLRLVVIQILMSVQSCCLSLIAFFAEYLPPFSPKR